MADTDDVPAPLPTDPPRPVEPASPVPVTPPETVRGSAVPTVPDRPAQSPLATLPTDPPWFVDLLDATVAGTPLASWHPSCTVPGRMSLRQTYRWLDANPSAMTRLAAARRIMAESVGTKVLDVADGPGDELDTPTRVNRDRLRADRLAWYAGILDPERYGDRRHGGEGSVSITVVTGVPVPARPASLRITRDMTDADARGGESGLDRLGSDSADPVSNDATEAGQPDSESDAG